MTAGKHRPLRGRVYVVEAWSEKGFGVITTKGPYTWRKAQREWRGLEKSRQRLGFTGWHYRVWLR